MSLRIYSEQEGSGGNGNTLPEGRSPVRLYRLALLREMARTGRLLAEVKGDRSIFDAVLRRHSIPRRAANDYIRLYLYFEQIEHAEAWGNAQGLRTPTTVKQALALLRKWQAMHLS